jgi:hypothetical protein
MATPSRGKSAWSGSIVSGAFTRKLPFFKTTGGAPVRAPPVQHEMRMAIITQIEMRLNGGEPAAAPCDREKAIRRRAIGSRYARIGRE